MKLVLFAISVAIFLSGCSSSRITHTWKNEKASIKKYNKILVLALSSDPDIRYQEKMENHLVGDLTDMGYSATSSLKEYGPKAFLKMAELDVISKLNSSGFDAVITIVLLDKSRERYYTPNRVQYSPYAMYHYNFGGYYTTMYYRIYSPDYYTIDTRYFWESNFYDVQSKELLYSAQTESFDPSSAESLGHQYGKMIVKDMVKNKVLVQGASVSLTK